MIRTLLVGIALAGIALTGVVPAQTLDLGTRRELFVDRLLPQTMRGTELRLHAPRREGVALRFDKPWEGAFAGYVTVLRDGDRFRMYYRGLPTAGRDGSQLESTCYAESRDGITWHKPELGLFELDGSKRNNVILKGFAPASHNFAPFVDANPECPEDARYKAFGGSSKGLRPFASADGIRWRPLADKPTLTGGAFDSQNVTFWSAPEQLYVCYFRTWDGYRSISRATSQDFVTWTKGVAMNYGKTTREHLYTNQLHPYVRAPHLVLGVAARFFPGKRVLTAAQAKAVGVHPRYAGDCSDAVLLTTRGGARIDRTFMAAFVRPGRGHENWVSRTNYPAHGLVLSRDGAQLYLYIQKNYGQKTARLDRYSLRPDGFASLHAPHGGGEMVTKPLRFAKTATQLELNFATSAAGRVQVEIQDENGKPLPGFALGDSKPLVGDELAASCGWRGGQSVAKIAGRTVRLRFVMKDADVYSLRFR